MNLLNYYLVPTVCQTPMLGDEAKMKELSSSHIEIQV